MTQYVHKRFSYKNQDKIFNDLCKVLHKLTTVKEKKYFLKDLLNRGERVMLVRRFRIAQMLFEDKTYDEIIKELKVGRTTIAKVERLLNFGRGGYKNAIKKSFLKKKR